MSGREDRSINRREVAYRLFAAEFEDADLEYSDSEEERAPNYVVTPTGARVNRLFVVGVLTEVEPVSDDVLRARVVDPTGAFVVYAGQYQPEAVAFLEAAEVPSFVAVTGKARTFRPDGGDRVFTSVRPETMTAVDAETRDRWTVQAAEHTLARVATMASSLDRAERGEALTTALRDAGVEPGLAAGVALAIDHYGTTAAYLAAVREQAVAAAGVVAGELEEAPALDRAPDEGGAVDAELTAAPAVVGTLGGAADAGSPSEPAASTADDDAPPPDASPEPAPEESAPEPAEPDESEPEPATASGEPGTEPVEPAGSGDASAEASDATDDLGDFADYGDESGDAPADAGADRYELDDAEREAVEAEYDTEFSPAGEVGDPGEAGIEPEAEQPTAASDESTGPPAEPDGPAAGDVASEAEEGAGDEAGAEAAAAGTEAADGDDGAEPEEAAADVDLEAAAVEAMAALDDGDGADREAVVAAVVDEHGVDPAAVEAAVQDALMDGRCYEPADGTLKAI